MHDELHRNDTYPFVSIRLGTTLYWVNFTTNSSSQIRTLENMTVSDGED